MDIIKIGEFISSCRKEKHLTQKDLAEHLGVSDKTVSKWERGINLPDASLYYPLCELLEISINELFAGQRLTNQEILKKSEKDIIENVENNKKFNKVIKAIRIAAICLVPFIFLQWRFKFMWIYLMINSSFTSLAITDFYYSLYLFCGMYLLSYLLIFREMKQGYYLMWIVFIVLCSMCLYCTRSHFELWFINLSLDLWINIVLTISGIITKELHPFLSFKRTS